MLDLALALALSWQDPPPAPKEQDPEPAVRTPAPPAFENWDDRRTREELKAFKDRLRGRKVSLAKRTEAVEALAKGRHEDLVKPLAKVVAEDPATTVRQLAADALGHQPQKEARRALLQLLRSKDLGEAPTVQAAVLRALNTVGYEGDDWEFVEPLFGDDYGPERVDLQKAVLELVTKHEEAQACDLLLDNLDPPQPADIDDPGNPPAAYWERRWKAWEVWREDVKKALFAITGQRFSTSEEARKWLDKNGRKLRRR